MTNVIRTILSFSVSRMKKIKLEVDDKSSSASASSQSPENVTVDFPDVTNVRVPVPDPLIASGRWYSKEFKTKEDLEAMTKDQIIKYAESKGYKMVRSKRKSELIEDIMKLQKKRQEKQKSI